MPKITLTYKNDMLSDLLSGLIYNITEEDVINYQSKPFDISITRDESGYFIGTINGETDEEGVTNE